MNLGLSKIGFLKFKGGKMQKLIISYMLEMVAQYKMFHWQTTSYAQHEAFGKIYDSLNDLTDTFVEILIGKYGRITDYSEIPVSRKFNVDEVKNYINGNIKFMLKLDSFLNSYKDKDLLNLRDEILGELNKLKYLLTLN